MCEKKDSYPDFLLEEENGESLHENTYDYDGYDEADYNHWLEFREKTRTNVPPGMEEPFTGHPNSDFTSLTNEKEILEKCPKVFFQKDNPWSNYTSHFLEKRGKDEEKVILTTHWQYLPESSDEVSRHQITCFDTILQSPSLSIKEKKAISAWMLSKILVEVPEYIER